MFKVTDGENIPIGLSYSPCTGRTFVNFKFPIWLSKKNSFVITKDTFLFGWKLKVILFRLMFACGDQGLGEQVDIGTHDSSKGILSGQANGGVV